MMYRSQILLCCLLLMLLPIAVHAQAEAFDPAECPFSVSLGMQIDCGYVTVPADHAQPDGDTIRLAVAILRTANPNPRPDPLVFLQGGPGGSTIQLELLNMPPLFGSILQERDVVLFDQRGTSLSEPRLDCPEVIERLLTNTAPQVGGTMSADMLGALRDCHDRLVGQGIDFSLYTTAQNAADVVALREALGYEQVNLYGVSYGTRLALAVLERDPAGIRSVVLDSTLPPDADIAGDEAAMTARAFDLVFDRCAADRVCHLVYPDPRGAFFELVETHNAALLHFTATRPQSDQSVEVTLNGDQLAEILAGLLPSSETAAFIPALIYDIRTGDYTNLEKLLFRSFDPRLANLSNTAMQYAVMCNDYLPVLSGARPSDTSAEGVFSWIGLFGNGQLPLICEQIGFTQLEVVYPMPVTSAVPTLLLAGEADPLTRFEWAQSAASTLEDSYLVIFPGQGHALLNTHSPCVTSITQAFLDNPTTTPVSTCVAEMKPTSIMLTASGTRPFARVSMLLLGGVALWGTGWAGMSIFRRRWGAAWRMSFRLMGWIGIVGAVIGILVMMLGQDDAKNPFPFANAVRAVEAVIPLVIGIQAAFAFSPDDEPGLEVLLASPRPIAWLLLERLGMILLVFGGLGLLATGFTSIVSQESNVLVALARWVAPALLFCGVGTYITIRSRQAAFSVAIIGVLWFIFSFMGAVLLPGMPTFWPLSLLQPFLWPVYAFLQPGDLSMGDYWLNRAVVASAGIGLIFLSVYQLRHEEQVMLGVMKSNRRSLRGES